jgi:hypothetical protein
MGPGIKLPLREAQDVFQGGYIFYVYHPDPKQAKSPQYHKIKTISLPILDSKMFL